MKKSILIFVGVVALCGCGHQVSTEMGQSEFYDYFRTCTHSRQVLDHFNSYSEMSEYCGCRARFIAQNVTFDEHRDMVRAEFETGLTRVSARVLNEAENNCNKK